MSDLALHLEEAPRVLSGQPAENIPAPPPLIIDDEFRHFVPRMSMAQYKGLEAEIVKDGRAREPLIVWAETGILLDGHNRFEICTRLHLPYTIDRQSFADREAVRRWLASRPMNKRNLTGLGQSYLRGLRYRMECGQRGANQYSKAAEPPGSTGILPVRRTPAGILGHPEWMGQSGLSSKDSQTRIGRDGPSSNPRSQALPGNARPRGSASLPESEADGLSGEWTAKRLGDEYGVSPSTIKRDRQLALLIDAIAANCGPDAKGLLLAGDYSISRPDIEWLAELGAEEQSKYLQVLKKTGRLLLPSRPDERKGKMMFVPASLEALVPTIFLRLGEAEAVRLGEMLLAEGRARPSAGAGPT